MASPLALLSLVILVSACQVLNGGDDATESADAAPPTLGSVPPRPNLSYSIDQRREVVSALVADLENARYTNQTVRFRTGRSDLPPPAQPPTRVASEDLAEELVAAPEAREAVRLAPSSSIATETGDGDTFADEDEGDDGSLGDFVRDLVRETEPTVEAPAADEQAAAPARTSSAAAPARTPVAAAAPAPEPTDDTGSEPAASEGGFLTQVGRFFGAGSGVDRDKGGAAAPDDVQTAQADAGSRPEEPAAVAVPEPAPVEPGAGSPDRPEPTAGSQAAPAASWIPEPRPNRALSQSTATAAPLLPLAKPTVITDPPAPSPSKPTT